MKFPDMTTTTINLPTTLLEQIDIYATKRIQNRSACVRELVTHALKDAENLKPSIPTDETFKHPSTES